MDQPSYRLKRQIRTIRLFYFMAGIGISAWAIVIPFAKIRLHLSDGSLGLILMASGSGGLLVMPLVGALISRYGSRAVLGAAGLVFALLLPLLSAAPDPLTLAMLLFVFGAAFAALDIAMNAQAVVLEARSFRLLLSGFHALYSIGSLTAALATSLLLKAGLPYPLCSLLFGVISLGILTQRPVLLPHRDDLPGGPAFALPNRATLVLGMCCFICFLTEGAVTDWSAIFLRFSRGASIADSSYGYAGFSVMMAISRLTGDGIATLFGKPWILRIGALIAAVGLLLAVIVPSVPAGILGFAMVGLGAGNIAPLVFGAAARVPGLAPSLSVPAVVSLGYLGFLIGPPLLGIVASHSTLSASLALDAALIMLVALAGRAVG